MDEESNIRKGLHAFLHFEFHTLFKSKTMQMCWYAIGLLGEFIKSRFYAKYLILTSKHYTCT